MFPKNLKFVRAPWQLIQRNTALPFTQSSERIYHRKVENLSTAGNPGRPFRNPTAVEPPVAAHGRAPSVLSAGTIQADSVFVGRIPPPPSSLSNLSPLLLPLPQSLSLFAFPEAAIPKISISTPELDAPELAPRELARRSTSLRS